MATHYLTLMEETQIQTRFGHSISTTYTFFNNTLTVYWKNRKIRSCIAKKGDHFMVSCHGRYVNVSPLVFPKDRINLIFWLLGYYPLTRANTFEKHFIILKNRRKRFLWENYQEYQITDGKTYIFAFCNKPYSNSFCALSGYMSNSLRTEDIFVIFKSIPFVHSRLIVTDGLKLLGFSPEEIKQIMQNNPKYKKSKIC